MNWKYYIPHHWDSKEDKTYWEDVYLMNNEDPNNSYWFTLESAGLLRLDIEDNNEYGLEDENPEIIEFLKKVEENEFIFNEETMDMTVNLESFNQEELLKYAKKCIGILGFKIDKFEEGTEEEFSGTNDHVNAVKETIELKTQCDKDPNWIKENTISLEEALKNIKKGEKNEL